MQEPHLRIGVHGRQPRQRPVELGDVPAVQPVGGVGEQQVPGLSSTGCTHQPSQYQEFSVRRWRRRCSPNRSRWWYIRSSAVVVSTRSACSPSQASAMPGSARTAARNSSSAWGYAPTV